MGPLVWYMDASLHDNNSPSHDSVAAMLPAHMLPGSSSHTCNVTKVIPATGSKKKSVVEFRHSSRNLKRVARMPAKDRREILKFLKKQARDQRARFLSHSNKSKERQDLIVPKQLLILQFLQ
jgi:hypothetical protein